MVNAFTIDVEEWYCSRPFATRFTRSQWPQLESRCAIGVDWLLRLLNDRNVRATWFVLGHVARRSPELVAEIAAAGHEIGTHGDLHHLLYDLTPALFEEDLRRSIDAIEEACGIRPRLYRAPCFSLVSTTIDWALPVLARNGITCDASLVPTGFHPTYGLAGGQLDPHQIHPDIFELPFSVATLFGMRLPASGGGYFRHFPYSLSRALMRRCNAQGRPVVFYLHPWEIDPGQPRFSLPFLQRQRQYRGIDSMRAKTERLLDEFSFTCVGDLLPELCDEVAKEPDVVEIAL